MYITCEQPAILTVWISKTRTNEVAVSDAPKPTGPYTNEVVVLGGGHQPIGLGQ